MRVVEDGGVLRVPGREGTAEQFLAVIGALTDQVAAQGELIAELRATVAELTARLGQDSSNSSRPPSSDGLRPAPKSLRRASGRKPGGQVGHKGSTLEMTDVPDQVVDHLPQRCGRCGHDLVGVLSASTERRQVVDLPPMAPVVTEHRLHEVTCPGCGAATRASAPAGVRRQVQYGPRTSALMAYLVDAQHLSVSRCAQAMSEVMGLPVATGTVQAVVARAAAVVDARFVPLVRDLLAAASVLHVDETGFKVAGTLAWAHSASDPHLTLIDVHAKRGRKAMDAVGVLPAFTGTLVHDAWAPYDTLGKVDAHQLCCAHVLRELRAVSDHHHDLDPRRWCWADQTAAALRTAIADPTAADQARKQITDALAATQLHHHPPGKLGAKHRALARRLSDRLEDYLRFTTDPAVPPTNNAAEQEIRMVKIKHKITGGMRTLTGARRFAAMRSYLATARKHHVPPLQAITTLFTGDPWLPAAP
ncbi:MAG: IS66 family transposase [Micrococcales bacterium]|nr:IS66 family transposase [Micrococcales bacterium]